MEILKGYKFRIYPDTLQKQFFIETFGCVRFVYNQLLQAKSNSTAQNLTPASLKKEYPFLKKTDSLALANAQRNLDRAFTNYYQGRAGYPKLKSKKNNWQSYTTNNQRQTIYVKEGYLKLPKLKSLVAIHTHREIKGKIKSATISAKDNDIFYVSILCVEEVTALPLTNELVGVTFSEESLAHCSKPLIAEYQHLQTNEEKLQKAQKKAKIRAQVAKKQKKRLSQAKNYQKQKQRVERLTTIKKNQKEDFLEQLSTRLVTDFDVIVVPKSEHLSLAKDALFSVADWQRFVQKIQYKAKWYGKQVLYVKISMPNDPKKIAKLGQKLLDAS